MQGGAWPICGHQRAVSLLTGEIRDRRVRHAYLFTGPDSVGKHALASAFASSLVCSNPPMPGSFCGVCDSCRRAARGTHPDIQIYSLDTQRQLAKDRTTTEHLTVDTVREISSASAFRAYSSEYRVIILDDAETLTEIAQEALLKTLEEPPPQLVLILLSDRGEALLPTIRSRCEDIVLSPVASSEISLFLTEQGETPDRAEQLAALAQGLPGWAIRAVSNADLVDDRELGLKRARDWVDAAPFDRIVRAFDLANEFSKSRESVFHELEATANYWRTVMMNSAGDFAAIDGVADRSQLAKSSLAESFRALVSVIECASDLQKNVRPRLALEAMVMKWPVSSREAE